MVRPNIVFITTDTQGREVISTYVDRPGVDTPSVDRLARQGVLFENAFTTCPLCTPARSTWYTGLYPHANGAIANNLSVGRHVPMLAEVLRSEGYKAHHIGKWHLDAAGYNGAGCTDGGFEEDTWYDLTNFFAEVGGRVEGNRWGGWLKGLDDIEYCFAHRVVDRAIETLQRQSGDPAPFFLSVSFDEPHAPYICPPPFRGRSAREGRYTPPTWVAPLDGKPRLQQAFAAWLAERSVYPESLPAFYNHYYDCNAYVDYEIGRVIDAVDRYCASDTVVVYTSDHGDHLGAFGLCAKGPTMYDHTIAVPLIVRAPQLTAPGRREPGLVSSVDVWATIVDLAGIPCRDRWDESAGYTGHSLVPVLEGRASAVRDTVHVEFNRFFARSGPHSEGFFPIRCVRTQQWKLNINLFDVDELYDLENDPEETTNLIDDPAYASARDELHDRLFQWQAASRDWLDGPAWGKRAWRPDYRHELWGRARLDCNSLYAETGDIKWQGNGTH